MVCEIDGEYTYTSLAAGIIIFLPGKELYKKHTGLRPSKLGLRRGSVFSKRGVACFRAVIALHRNSLLFCRLRKSHLMSCFSAVFCKSMVASESDGEYFPGSSLTLLYIASDLDMERIPSIVMTQSHGMQLKR